MLNNKKLKTLSMAMIIIILFGLYSSVPAVHADEVDDMPIVVSMGDSYSAGEGLGDYYGWKDDFKKSVKNGNEFEKLDFLAHRSKKAWAGQLKFGGKKLCDHRCTKLSGASYDKEKDGCWFFVACTGAETKDFIETKECSYNRYGLNNKVDKDNTDKQKPQLSVFKDYKIEGEVDYVTLTIGGNDLGFASIAADVVIACPILTPGIFAYNMEKAYDMLDPDNKDNLPDKLKGLYLKILKEAGEDAQLIVAGYPRLYDGASVLNKTKNLEMGIVNKAVDDFNEEISRAVKECGNKNVHFVSVADGFKDKGAYSSLINKNKEYINRVNPFHDEYDLNVFVNVKSQSKYNAYLDYIVSLMGMVSSRSMHPNKKGAEVYTKCVQSYIDEKLEPKRKKKKTTTTATTTATTTTTEVEPVQLYTELLDAYKAAFEAAAIGDYAAVGTFYEQYGIEGDPLPENAKDTYGYVLMDITGDGQDELIVGNDGYITSVFTAKEKKYYNLINGWMRQNVILLPDGKFFSSGSGGASTYQYYLWEYSPGETKEVVKEGYIYDALSVLYPEGEYDGNPSFEDDRFWFYTTDDDGDISNDKNATYAEAQSFIDRYSNGGVTLNFTPFS